MLVGNGCLTQRITGMESTKNLGELEPGEGGVDASFVVSGHGLEIIGQTLQGATIAIG
jgi:hypothetical protein